MLVVTTPTVRRREGRLLHRRCRQRHACRHRDGHRGHPLTVARAALGSRRITRQKGLAWACAGGFVVLPPPAQFMRGYSC